MKISDAIKIFMDNQILKGNSAATFRYYKNHIKYFTDWLNEDIDINDITDELINEYRIYIIEKKPNHNSINNNKLSSVTMATYLRPIKILFRYLNNQGITNIDIEKFELPKQQKKIIDILNYDEMQKILNCFNENTELGCRNKTMLSLLLDCGLRRKELIELKIDNIKFEQNIIKIENAKGSKDRLIPLGILSKKLLYKYIYNFRPLEEIETGRLFLKSDGTPINVDVIRTLFTRLKQKTGIKRLTPHLCRHTFATYYLVNGGDSLTLQIILGHSTLKMVTTYIHLANTIKLYENNRNSLIDKLYQKKYKG